MPKSKPNIQNVTLIPGVAKIPAKYSHEEIMKKHRIKHASIQFRTDLIRAHARASYQNEYSRLSSMLHNHLLHQSYPEREILERRLADIKKLAGESVHSQNHEISKRYFCNPIVY
jgi:hypothetical protein